MGTGNRHVNYMRCRLLCPQGQQRPYVVDTCNLCRRKNCRLDHQTVDTKRRLNQAQGMVKYLVPLLFLLLGLACHVAFRIIDAQIELDGPLVEPFFLIPIGYLLYALGIITGLIIRIRSG